MTTLDAIDPELLANLTATLATVGPNGGPQMTGVWFLVEDTGLQRVASWFHGRDNQATDGI